MKTNQLLLSGVSDMACFGAFSGTSEAAVVLDQIGDVNAAEYQFHSGPGSTALWMIGCGGLPWRRRHLRPADGDH